MQAIIQNPIKLIKKDRDQGKKDNFLYLLNKLENADNMLKNDIENQLVRMGINVVENLITALESSKGVVRATIAMALIRIGMPSVEPLKIAYEQKEDSWIADYIIREIEGSKQPLGTDFEFAPQEALVG